MTISLQDGAEPAKTRLLEIGVKFQGVMWDLASQSWVQHAANDVENCPSLIAWNKIRCLFCGPAHERRHGILADRTE